MDLTKCIKAIHRKFQNVAQRYHRKSNRHPENIYFCFTDYAKALDYVDHNKLENSERDRNTRPLDLPLEKPIGSNS